MNKRDKAALTLLLCVVSAVFLGFQGWHWKGEFQKDTQTRSDSEKTFSKWFHPPELQNAEQHLDDLKDSSYKKGDYIFYGSIVLAIIVVCIGVYGVGKAASEKSGEDGNPEPSETKKEVDRNSRPLLTVDPSSLPLQPKPERTKPPLRPSQDGDSSSS